MNALMTAITTGLRISRGRLNDQVFVEISCNPYGKADARWTLRLSFESESACHIVMGETLEDVMRFALKEIRKDAAKYIDEYIKFDKSCEKL